MEQQRTSQHLCQIPGQCQAQFLVNEPWSILFVGGKPIRQHIGFTVATNVSCVNTFSQHLAAVRGINKILLHILMSLKDPTPLF